VDGNSRNIINFIIYLFILTANEFLPDGSVRHNTQITHQAQTKHSTQNYTKHNEYNTNTITATII
jgi:hypothetical protein